ncbi:MAG: phage tail sheath C-terminal domain-containing protein [Pseudomonadota bacterium]
MTKTPGVYIVEKNSFPNAVVEVATAVPAFIGYTATATSGGTSLVGKPWRITSMSDYTRYFGGAPKPLFSIKSLDTGTKSDLSDTEAAPSQSIIFTHGSRQYALARKAGKDGGRFLMYQAMLHFFQNGGGACYIVSVGTYDDDIVAGDETKGLVAGFRALLKEQEPTMVLTPDAVLLSRADCNIVQAAALKHCGLDMRNRFAILDVWGGEYDRQDTKGDCIDNFRDDIGINHLSHAAAYYPWLHTSVVQDSEVDYGIIENPADLATAISAELGLANALAGDEKTKAVTDMLVDALVPSMEPQRSLLHKSLSTVSTLYQRVLDESLKLINLMPPSAAMAGAYTMVDNTRGVWKAPANVSIAGVIRPTVEIADADQDGFNVSTQGKSINTIRSFINEGVLVWGARTLDSNSLDWRYINVRRTMIMLEESCQLAVKALVFEPNVSNTWVTIRSMISNFLTGIWKRGGLAGANMEDAFSVHCGLGETMTSEDILEGILRVTVLVALVRPAEFIEITFQQQQMHQS